VLCGSSIAAAFWSRAAIVVLGARHLLCTTFLLSSPLSTEPVRAQSKRMPTECPNPDPAIRASFEEILNERAEARRRNKESKKDQEMMQSMYGLGGDGMGGMGASSGMIMDGMPASAKGKPAGGGGNRMGGGSRQAFPHELHFSHGGALLHDAELPRRASGCTLCSACSLRSSLQPPVVSSSYSHDCTRSLHGNMVGALR
jgi:hypothetical protein